jgi:hypothetical protein
MYVELRDHALPESQGIDAGHPDGRPESHEEIYRDTVLNFDYHHVRPPE